MAKTIPALLQAHYDTRSLTSAVALRIDRADAEAFGFTSADEPVTFSGLEYEAGSLTASSITSNADMSVDNLELTAIDDGTLFTQADIRGGLWANARWFLFAYNYRSPSDGIEAISAGTLGNVRLEQGKIIVELRGLQQYLQQPQGDVSSKTCRARLGDGKCRKDLTSFTHSGAVTAVASRQAFTASALTQASDYFGDGVITWNTGANAGLQQRVKSFASGAFGLVLPMVRNIEIGDTFTAVAGCRKRRDEDCKTKFDNILNFQGEPDLPGVDALTAAPEASE